MVARKLARLPAVIGLVLCMSGQISAGSTDGRLALLPSVSVLLMGSEAESLAAEEVLFQMGIPHYVTRSPREASHAAMMMVSFGQVDEVSDQLVEAFHSYLRSGGVILAQKARDPKLASIFGYDRAVASKGRHEIIWDERQHPLKAYVDAPEENVLRLGSYNHQELFWTVGYRANEGEVLARFDDATAAVIEKVHKSGTAIALGGSLIDLVIRAYLDRDFGVQKVGANAFEPSTDGYLLLIKAAYEAYVPTGFTISTTPPDKRGSLILTHDLDAQSSFVNISDFAKTEKRYGARSTIFVQTKHIPDYYDKPFMTVENLSQVRKLHSAGFEIASHTVAHTPHFEKLPKGQIITDPDAYRPQVINMSETVNATVRGEVWVSKSIIRNNILEDPESFRSGHLLFNSHLIASLEEAGFLYDSSMGAYHCGCNFPFRQYRSRSFSEKSHILEIPVSMSDYDWVDNMIELIPAFRQIILKNAANGAVATMLIHPTRKSDKLETLDQLLHWLPDDIWTGTIAQFGRFWNSRYGLNPEITVEGPRCIVTFRTDRATEEVAVHLNSSPTVVVADPEVEIRNRTRLVLPPMEKGDSLRLVLVHHSPEAQSVSIRSPGGPVGGTDLTYTASVATGAESYDDYDREGQAPIIRGALSLRKPLFRTAGLKIWDYFGSRLGEAEETQNEAGITYDGSLFVGTHVWVRAANRTYRRKFTASTLQFNEPRLGITLRWSSDRLTCYLDSRYLTAFYSAPDSIEHKTFHEVVAEPAVRYRFTDVLSARFRGTLGRREYGDENAADIYQTDFTRYGALLAVELGRGEVRLSVSSEWSLRAYSEGRDRCALRHGLDAKIPVAARVSLGLRANYLDAEFTESDYDRFFWGEALISYSISPRLMLTHWKAGMISVGGTYRVEDYKTGPYDMKYLSGWLGFSTSF